jgi:copper chaperone
MKTLKFKTNIKCGACVEKVTPALNSDENIKEWNVDLKSAERILSVSGENVTEKEVEELVKKAGYSAEPIA